jgi:hypothetical protein
MNSEYPTLTVNAELVSHVLDQVRIWSEGQDEPWEPSRGAENIAQTVRNSCPRMVDALEAAEIFLPWSEMLYQQVLNSTESYSTYSTLSASEIAYEVRSYLVPCSWEMQEEWLAAYCDDYEPIPDPDLYGPDDPRHSRYVDPYEYEEDDDEDGVLRLRFLPGEAELIKGKLEEAVRAAMTNRKLSPEKIMQIGAFLWLVERLPVHHEEYTGKIELSYDHGEGAGWTMVTISEEGLALDKGEIFRGSWGSDHESKTVFRVTSTCGSNFYPDFYLEEWLQEFVSDAGDKDVNLSIEWFPEEEMPGAGC